MELNCSPQENRRLTSPRSNDLHARFHVEADQVLDLILRGKKADPEKAMSMDSSIAKSPAR